MFPNQKKKKKEQLAQNNPPVSSKNLQTSQKSPTSSQKPKPTIPVGDPYKNEGGFGPIVPDKIESAVKRNASAIDNFFKTDGAYRTLANAALDGMENISDPQLGNAILGAVAALPKFSVGGAMKQLASNVVDKGKSISGVPTSDNRFVKAVKNSFIATNHPSWYGGSNAVIQVGAPAKWDPANCAQKSMITSICTRPLMNGFTFPAVIASRLDEYLATLLLSTGSATAPATHTKIEQYMTNSMAIMAYVISLKRYESGRKVRTPGNVLLGSYVLGNDLNVGSLGFKINVPTTSLVGGYYNGLSSAVRDAHIKASIDNTAVISNAAWIQAMNEYLTHASVSPNLLALYEYLYSGVHSVDPNAVDEDYVCFHPGYQVQPHPVETPPVTLIADYLTTTMATIQVAVNANIVLEAAYPYLKSVMAKIGIMPCDGYDVKRDITGRTILIYEDPSLYMSLMNATYDNFQYYDEVKGLTTYCFTPDAGHVGRIYTIGKANGLTEVGPDTVDVSQGAYCSMKKFSAEFDSSNIFRMLNVAYVNYFGGTQALTLRPAQFMPIVTTVATPGHDWPASDVVVAFLNNVGNTGNTALEQNIVRVSGTFNFDGTNWTTSSPLNGSTFWRGDSIKVPGYISLINRGVLNVAMGCDDEMLLLNLIDSLPTNYLIINNNNIR